jgi:hypothetical protein
MYWCDFLNPVLFKSCKLIGSLFQLLQKELHVHGYDLEAGVMAFLHASDQIWKTL